MKTFVGVTAVIVSFSFAFALSAVLGGLSWHPVAQWGLAALACSALLGVVNVLGRLFSRRPGVQIWTPDNQEEGK